jgi:hypothetical protein
MLLQQKKSYYFSCEILLGLLGTAGATQGIWMASSQFLVQYTVQTSLTA